MPERRCCANCFGDYLIRDQYVPMCDPLVRTCDYCGSENVDCVVPSRLSPWFETLMATYEVDEEGDPIVQLLQEEWRLFEGSGLNAAQAKELLSDVLDDGQRVRLTYRAIQHPSGGHLRDWEDLRGEMMHRNRWFLDEPMDMARVAELLSQLITQSSSLSGVAWHRARLMSGDELFPLDEMGAPPRHLAGHGRANPAGIPYLYLGSSPATAVAELRPHTGEMACIADFALPDLTFADLRDPRGRVSPLLEEEGDIIRLRADLPLLERLGMELTRPIQPRGAPYEYIPTQYLCEYIKTQSFDGVLYRSSVSADNGFNLALFNPSRVVPTNLRGVSVEQVTVRISS
ncbi:RES domain-containing protein [Plantibacter flavus]|uniref:RES domain-containing protein n=1 Tax=Plantibacter flavus TaxID=150123 RepID=A0A3N2C6S1_9MICO|nr:RES family NAD+ phosphorylase [Plantibacter flavus]ROR83209.1 RES domain-containing protein [Plantibacter flavus]SMG45540.1 RES domain-containing protein [Plantibacter flavus]